MNETAANYRSVLARIARAQAAGGRAPGSTALIVVSKTFSADEIEPLLALRQKVFGENRVQEAQAKWPQLKVRHDGIQLHLIGPLQSNKAGEAVALFDVIETVDREKIAAALAAEIKRQGRAPELFVQVNTGNEMQKAGIDPKDTGAFIKSCREKHGLAIGGLMCIPPAGEDPVRHFELLAKLAKENGLAKLSMGMSGDFEAAIGLGATHVRVGSAIFGSR